MNKVKIFEFICINLFEWYNKSNNIKTIESFNNQNDFGKLKLLSLLTFISHKENDKLFEIFDNFHARPFGTFESDIRTLLNTNDIYEFKYFKISKYNSEFSEYDLDYFNDLDENIKDIVLNTIKDLVKTSYLVNLSVSQLSEILNKYKSHVVNYNARKDKNIFEIKISVDEMKTDEKFFLYNYFELI